MTADPRRRRFYMAGALNGGYQLWQGERDGGWQQTRLLPGPHYLAYLRERDVLWGGRHRPNDTRIESVIEFASDGGTQEWAVGAGPAAVGPCVANDQAGVVECLSGTTPGLMAFVDGGFGPVVPFDTIPPTAARGFRAVTVDGSVLVHGGSAFYFNSTRNDPPGRLKRFAQGRFSPVDDGSFLRRNHTLAADPNTGDLYATGGFELTWNGIDEWLASTTPADGTWRFRSPGPWQRIGAGAPLNNHVGVAFDGGVYAVSSQATWVFDGAQWQQVPQTGLPTSGTPIQVASAAQGRIYNLRWAGGGSTTVSVWTAQLGQTPLTWSRIPSAQMDLDRCGWAFDDERNVVVFFGCQGSVAFELTADGGVSQTRTNDPEGDQEAQLDVNTTGAFESAQGRLLAFSSQSTWALNRAENRPAVRLSSPLSSLDVDVQAPLTLNIQISARGSGSSPRRRPRVPVLGYELMAHIDGAFRSIGRLESNGALQVTVPSLCLSRLAPGPSLVVEVRPLGVNGVDQAEIQVDAFSVSISRRP